VFDQHLHATPPSLESLAPKLVVPPGLDAVLQRALAKEPRKRFQSMRELWAALEQLDSASPLRRLFRTRRSETGSQVAVVARKFDEDAPTLRSQERESPHSNVRDSDVRDLDARDPDHVSIDIELP
jgi:hypothetical protein